MSNCEVCPVEKDCHYLYKPCDCVHQRKFWSLEKRMRHNNLGKDKEIWVVLDEDGWPVYCAGWSGACHEHINEAIDQDADKAGKWTVRQVELLGGVKS